MYLILICGTAGAQHNPVPDLSAPGGGGPVQQCGGDVPELAEWKDAPLALLQHEAPGSGGEREAVHQSDANGQQWQLRSLCQNVSYLLQTLLSTLFFIKFISIF